MNQIKLFHIEDVKLCKIIRRINQFTVLVDQSGEKHTAWINNTGRLEEYMRNGIEAYVQQIQVRTNIGYLQ